MADVELVRLIDLSLGKEPCGVVNFNYMHSLMHEIVRRLYLVEGGAPSDIVQEKAGSRIAFSKADLTEKVTEESEANLKVERDKEQEEGKDGVDETRSSSSIQLSRQVKRMSSRSLRPRTSIISAANDLGALERKITELETRMETMEELPRFLERKASDNSSTPVNDMLSLIQVNKRLDAAEQGLHKTATLVDDLLGEFNAWKDDLPKLDALKDALDSLRQEVSQNNTSIKKLEEMISLLENLQPGEGLLNTMSDLRERLDALQGETKALQEGQLQASEQFVTWTGLEDALKAHQRPKTPRPLHHPSPEALDALEKIGALSEDFETFSNRMADFEEMLAKKVDSDNLTSMLPKGDIDSLLPMLMDMQGKLALVESEMSGKSAVSPETLEQISAMRKAIDSLTSDLSNLSHQVTTAGIGRVEELGSYVAQLRERIADLDRAVTALSTTLASLPDKADAEDAPPAFVDMDAFMELQGIVGDVKQHQDRLLDTAAHLSNELSVNQEHVKNLYGTVDVLKETKADKETMQIEVDEKADRRALEAKASRQWVESTFEKLDREIREARTLMEAHDEMFKGTMDRITNDIDAKLDRDEMETLRDFIERKLKDTKQPIIHQSVEPEGDEAAGFKKRMKVRCISCDKPVGMKTNQDAPVSLPQGQIMPPQKTFRPYTTYELELIRQHQRAAYQGFLQNYSSSLRSAGGSHTMTHPHRKMRVAPLNSQYANELYQTMQGPNIQEEVGVVGQDGHVYKGRLTRRLPHLYSKPKTAGRRTMVPKPPPGQRPSTSPTNIPASLKT